MKNRWRIVLAVLFLVSLFGWRAVKDVSENMKENNKTLQDLIWDFSLVSSAPLPLVDNQALYGDGSQDDVVLPLYVIVLPTQDTAGAAVTFAELNAIKDYRVEKPLLRAYFADNSSEASAYVSELADQMPLGNALITLRGHSTLSSEKKSYKIKLNAETQPWRGQMTINLNKHPNDESRLRNKIAFDLIRLIPNLTSMQTHFVNLYVKDLSAGSDGGFVDYGLFTQIEQGNKLFLKNHNLDENGSLYKANYFEFLRYPEHLKNVDDPGYDPVLFEENLEICAGTNHEKLIKMIEDVNNQALDIDLVHSGDATIVFPAQKIYFETARRIKRISRLIADSLNITGPFNIQFLARDNNIKVIECNLRASRSMPFVSKVLKVNLIELATKVMLGVEVTRPHKSVFDLDYVGVKAPQFSFSRLAKADPVLGVDMASTGEVGCIGEGFYEAILKAMYSVGYRVPQKSILLSTGPARSKVEMLNSARALKEKGYKLYATRGTQQFLENAGVEAEVAFWPDEKESPNTIELIRSREVDLVVNIPKDLSPTELNNDYQIRRSAIDFNIPLLTNARLASAFILAFCKLTEDDIAIKSWDEY